MFKVGDKVICTWKDQDQTEFTVGKVYTIGGEFHNESDKKGFGVMSDDNGKPNGHLFNYVKMEKVTHDFKVVKETAAKAAGLAVEGLITSMEANGPDKLSLKVDNYVITIKKK